jgi:hypothetical protein
MTVIHAVEMAPAPSRDVAAEVTFLDKPFASKSWSDHQEVTGQCPHPTRFATWYGLEASAASRFTIGPAADMPGY